jgi:hypothetical protein
VAFDTLVSPVSALVAFWEFDSWKVYATADISQVVTVEVFPAVDSFPVLPLSAVVLIEAWLREAVNSRV